MEIFNNYRNAFKDRDDIKVQTNDENTKNSNWMFGIRIPRQLSYKVAEEFFNSNNIEIRPMFYSIFSHKHLENNANVLPADCKVANLLNQKCIILPSFPELNSQEQSHIINVVNKYANLCKINIQ
jgi:dTDP-4-amino-4,6-dideoxygalactose transaminase